MAVAFSESQNYHAILLLTQLYSGALVSHGDCDSQSQNHEECKSLHIESGAEKRPYSFKMGHAGYEKKKQYY